MMNSGPLHHHHHDHHHHHHHHHPGGAAVPNHPPSNLDPTLLGPFHFHGHHELAQIMLLPPNPNQPPPPPPPPSLTPAPAAGPLGPFTGYAAVLRTSRFLKPAQQLLEELCAAVKGGRVAEEGMSSSSLCSSTELISRGGGGGALVVHCSDDFHQRKAKLLCLQDEVSRRYKQYHQQIQTIVASFESVPGLSAATPFAALALKSVSRSFRRTKAAILCQIQEISRILGDEYSASSPSSSRGNNNNNALVKSSRSRSLPYMECNHPVWRPQRGLPEKAVALLRAWLFDHFLHPYPTDADKHVLATQTGLTRNQVSNWFINARVRLWKPMVEEIHTLETKGKSNNNNGHNYIQSNNNISGSTNILPDAKAKATVSITPDCSSTMLDPNNIWHVDKRSRVEDEPMEENLISFGGYSGGEMGNINGFGGAVSLTLGLRHEGIQQQQQQMRQFGGGHMLHDFVG